MKLVFAALVITAGFLFVSCSSNDDDSSPASIVGKWNYSKTITSVNGGSPSTQNYEGHEVGCDKDYQQFADGGIFRDVVLYKNASDVCTEDANVSTWVKTGNTLTIGTSTYTISGLTSSELRYESTTSTGGVSLKVIQVFTKS